MIRSINIELFCCAGGMAEGFRRAGIEFDMAFDADPNACDSYEANLGHRPIQMDCRDLLRMLDSGWSPGPVGLFVADPPCTPWSRAGKRKGIEDERDMLRETAQFIEKLQPEVWLIGNVPGLDDSDNWGTVQKVIGGLTQFGYCIDYVKLDAANYGVPQHRIRPFWVGHRVGTPCVAWPRPTHGDPETIGSPKLGEDRVPWITCRAALSHLPVEELGVPRRLRMNLKSQCPPSQAQEPARTILASPPRAHKGGAVLSIDEKHRAEELDKPSHTITGGGAGHSARPVYLMTNKNHPISRDDRPAYAILSKAQQGAQGGSVINWPWERPATTIQKDDRIDAPGHHPEEWRSKSEPNCVVLSETAAAILQGFPETWVFSGKTKKDRWGQIGQAMPPALAQAVASSIVAAGYLDAQDPET